MTRSELVDYVLQLNGAKTPINKSAYYGTNFRDWEAEQLIKKQSRGVFVPGKLAKLYINHPDKYKARVKDEELKRYKEAYYKLWSEQRRLASRSYEEKKAKLSSFIYAMSDACNKSGILYEDMVWQEELIDFQSAFATALHQAWKDGVITTPEVMSFEHVFSLEKN